MATYKGWILKTGVAFISILLILTFFSNTIYTFNLPSVTVSFIGDGVISESASGEGFAEFMETELLYAASTGRIELLAEEGDTVTVGQPLYILTTDEEELEKSQETAQNEYDKVLLRISKTADDIAFTKQAIANTERDQSETDDAALNQLSAFRYEIANFENDIALKEDELAKKRILFENGTIPQNDITVLENDLAKLQNSLLQTQEKLKTAEDAYQRSQQDAASAGEETYNEEIDRLNQTLADLEYERQTAELDKARFEAIIRDLAEQKANGGTITVNAESAGKITETADFETSAAVQENSLILKIGVTGANYFAVLKFPEDTGFIKPGDVLPLSVRSRELHGIEGTVTQAVIGEGYLNVRVAFTAEGLSGGEEVTAKAEKVSELFSSVLPNSAVRQDPETGLYYFLYAEKQNNLFGYEYYARQQLISVEEQDEENTAFYLIGMGNNVDNPPAIINTDAAVSIDDRIRVVGGSDLIEIR